MWLRVASKALTLAAVLALLADFAAARLSFQAIDTGKIRGIFVSGEFEANEDLGEFTRMVSATSPEAVMFNSPGGSPLKAMELGRLIRSYHLTTVQARAVECASACALAFLGGSTRMADPGSIGVHQSSFTNSDSLDAGFAASEIQKLTAMEISYLVEMGINPALLQLALQYEKNDIRYLSGSEMAEYGVVTSVSASNPTVARLAPQPSSSDTQPPIPEAKTGVVRHPKGVASLKAASDNASDNVADFPNGTPVSILGNENGWYHVSSGRRSGYLHQSWVHVDQYQDELAFGARHIQVKSFDTLASAKAFTQGSRVPLAIYLASNGWFAVTLENAFQEEQAKDFLRHLKEDTDVPKDAFVTYGNTYVRRVCCR